MNGLVRRMERITVRMDSTGMISFGLVSHVMRIVIFVKHHRVALNAQKAISTALSQNNVS